MGLNSPGSNSSSEKALRRLWFKIDESLMNCIANQVGLESRKHTEKAATSSFCVLQKSHN